MLYVNGDSHTAGAEAVNPHAFAEDDGNLFYLGRAPHPENLAVSWGKLLSLALRSGFRCDAESASSNARILRTTREWLAGPGANHNDLLVIIQWSTWEREEWLFNDVYYQVGSSGLDELPLPLQDRYRQFVIDTNWDLKTKQAHDEIWAFHQELEEKNIRHIFFNGNSDFSKITDRKDWGLYYIDPYNPEKTYDAVIQAQGIDTVAPNSWHFGRDGHAAWNRFLINYIVKNKLV